MEKKSKEDQMKAKVELIVKYMKAKPVRFEDRDCSICNYPLGFVSNGEGDILYDTTCNCVSYPTVPTMRTWGQLISNLLYFTGDDNYPYEKKVDDFIKVNALTMDTKEQKYQEQVIEDFLEKLSQKLSDKFAKELWDDEAVEKYTDELSDAIVNRIIK